jgi:hypothetical protein
VPPEACAVRVTDCPASIVGDEGVIAPAARAESTVTAAVEEKTASASVDVSVTL